MMTSAQAPSMEQYYFDTDNGQQAVRADEALAFASRDEMRSAAMRALSDMANDGFCDDRCVLTVKVRDGGGRYVFHAALSLVADWLD